MKNMNKYYDRSYDINGNIYEIISIENSKVILSNVNDDTHTIRELDSFDFDNYMRE